MSTDDLGQQERAVLDAITANPFAGQQEIALALGLARSTVAAHVVQLVQKGYILGRGYVLPTPKRIMCLGGAAVDRTYLSEAPLDLSAANAVSSRRSFGGVARNVAENLARLGVVTGLTSIVGDDENGRAVLRQLRDIGIDVSQIVVHPERGTAEYVQFAGPDGRMLVGLADMGIFDVMSVAQLERAWPHLAAATWVFVDCNMPAEVVQAVVARKDGARFRLAVNAVSAVKGRRLPGDLSGIDILFLTLEEARAMLDDAGATPRTALEALAARGAHEIVLDPGDGAILVAAEDRVTAIPHVPAKPVDGTGANDALIAGTLYRVLAGERLASATRIGTLLAALTSESDMNVHPNLTPRFLSGAMSRLPEPAETTTR